MAAEKMPDRAITNLWLRQKEDGNDSSSKNKRKIRKINHYSSQEEISQSTSENDSSKNDPSKNDSSKNDASKNDASKNDASENESSKTDSSPNNKDSSEKEAEAENEKLPDFTSIVAAHYNSVETGFDRRNSSRIYYLRNFNNWVKSLLIKESVWQVQDYNQRKLKVLDMCCGKGGDLFKWAKLNIRYMVCTDIAEFSLDQYKARYNEYMEKCRRNEKHCDLECEFIPADCTRMRLRGKYHDPSIQFDIVSCQFSFHYCFESLPQAECMLKNASECLKPGGLFIGTIPNSLEIVKRLKQSETNSFKNDVCALEMCCTEPYPLFGAKYNFYLEGVVNCAEFLVHFSTFERLAQKFGFQLVKKEKFTDFFERGSKTRPGEILLKKIKALEIYPSPADRKLVGPFKDYMHARIFCEQKNVKQVGTLSKCDWDVISLYQTFVFKKVAST